MEFNATFLISIISFILFVIIMNFIFYKPIEKIVNERKKFIDDNFDEAKKNNGNSKKLTDEYSKRIEETNSQCKDFLNEKTEKAKLKRDELIAEAQVQSSEKIDINQKELNKTFEETKKSLKEETVNLANSMTNKLFGEKVTLDNIDEKLINQFMNEG